MMKFEKNYIFYFLFVVFVVVKDSKAQEPPCYPSTTICYIGRKYSYLFCDPQNGPALRKLCAERPLEDYAPLRPIMWPLNKACVNFPQQYAGDFLTEIPANGKYYFPLKNGGDFLIYERYRESQLSQNSIDEWTCLCPPPTDPKSFSCCVQIKYSDDYNLFPQSETGTAATFTVPIYNNVSIDKNCDLDCKLSKIYINQTPAKLDFDTYFRPYAFGTMYYTGYLSSPVPEFKTGYELINLVDVLRHEIGHLFGLSHHEDCGTQGTSNRMNDGIMNKNHKINNPYARLSQDDVCAFKRLYCPDVVVSTEWSTDNRYSNFTNNLEVVPIPFAYDFQIRYESSTEEIASFIISNLTGQVLDETEVLIQNGANRITINTSHLNCGLYICTLGLKKQHLSSLFIKLR